MSKFNQSQTNFSSGELSRRMEGRTDIKEHKDGAALLQNMITVPSGGAIKRPGTQYKATVLDEAVIIPFIVDKETAYVIEISPNSYEDTYFESINIKDNSGAAATFSISNIAWGFSKNLDKHGFYYVQSADVLFLTHVSGTKAPIVIARNNAESTPSVPAPDFVVFSYFETVSSFLNVDLGAIFDSPINDLLKYPFMDTNLNGDILLNPNALNPTSLGAEDSSTATVDFFNFKHIGALFRLNHAGSEGVVKVTDVRSNVQTFTADASTDVFTCVGHGYSEGEEVYLSYNFGASVIPVPLVGFDPTTALAPSVPYYIITTGLGTPADEFKLARTLEDAQNQVAIDITTNGSGTLEIYSTSEPNVSSCTVTALVTCSATTATDNWRESAWSNYRGWPKTVTIYEGRLIWGGNRTFPDTVWLSLTGNLFLMMSEKLAQDSSTDASGINFFGDSVVGDPLFFAIGNSEVPLIQWISADSVLQIGTLSQEYIVSGPSGAAISKLAGGVQVKTQTTHGGRDVKAIRAYNSVIFISRNGKQIRNYKFNNKNGSYISQNLNILSDLIVMEAGASGATTYSNVNIVQLAYQQSKNLIWALTSRNKLLSLSFAEETDVIAWARHEIGGTGIVHGITVLPSTDSDTDELWLSVERTVDSAQVYYLEKLGDDFFNTSLNGQFTSDSDFPWFSDSALRLTDFGNAKTAWSGLDHLEGEVVQILADGVFVGTDTVSSGAITLTDAAEEIIVGLQYVSRIKSMDLEAGRDFGSSQGNKQRIDRLAVYLDNSLGGKIGRDFDNLEDLEYLTANTLFTGVIAQTFNGTPDEEARFCIEHSDPTPFSVLSVTARGVGYD